MRSRTSKLGPVRLAVAGLSLALATGGGWVAQEDASGSAAFRERIDSVRNALVELRFEEALQSLETLLSEAGLSESERVEALVLRAQTHVAFGDLGQAETDYREILVLRPAYVPDSSLTPKKAMQRFEKARADIVAQLKIEIDPADARVTLDGQPVQPNSDGFVPVAAGDHFLRAEREGYDPVDRVVIVEAGKQRILELTMSPNARTVVVLTDAEDVEVWLDGARMGTTKRGLFERDAGASTSARLVLEAVPLGEHEFELRKSCHRTERFREILNVDLLDRGPLRLAKITMRRAASTILLEGGPAGARVTIGGQSAGRLPIEPYEVCPGPREIEVQFGGRLVWRERVELRESAETRLEVRPRPNAALIGADEWPAPLADFGAGFNTVAGISWPDRRDPAETGDWVGVNLPPDTDLAVVVLPATRDGARDRWYLYSPILGTAQALDLAPLEGRPRWNARVWGLSTADSTIGGPARVVAVAEGGPAAAAGLRPGDRVLTVAGRPTEDSRAVRGALDRVTGEAVDVEWRTFRGEQRKASLTGVASPKLVAAEQPANLASVRAAWALSDAISSSDREASALANLALLFSAYGQHQLAAETWRRVDWGKRRGIGEGTAQYYLARELEMLGQEKEAIDAYRRAAASAATTFNDHGPAVRPAALDRLADLGVDAE